MAALRHKLAAVQRELANATEEEYSRLASRSVAAAAAPAGGLQLAVDVDSLVREIQQQHAPVVVQVRLRGTGWPGCWRRAGRRRRVDSFSARCGLMYKCRHDGLVFARLAVCAAACAWPRRITCRLIAAAPPCSSLQAPPPEVAQNIVPINIKPLEKSTIRPEGTGEEVLLQGFNWDRCGGGAAGRVVQAQSGARFPAHSNPWS